MATDPYQTLGVARTVSEAELRTAYRKLAKQFHPDLNPGKPEAVERFKRINAAWDLLSDKDKRARFDRGELDAEGNERAPQRPSWRDYAEAPGQRRHEAAGMSPEELEAIMAQAFGRGGAPRDRRGEDLRYTLTIGFLDAVNGLTRRVTLPDGREIDVRIPAGTEDGHVLRLRGQGGRGRGKGPPGDALIEVAVAPHKLFRREGDDIVLTLPVTLHEAVLGATVEVPTIGGAVRLAIPPGSGDGTRLRLRLRGVAGRGHQFVTLNVAIPPGEEPALAAFLREWTPVNRFDPRAGLAEAGAEAPAEARAEAETKAGAEAEAGAR